MEWHDAMQDLTPMPAEAAKAALATPLNDPRVKALVEALRAKTIMDPKNSNRHHISTGEEQMKDAINSHSRRMYNAQKKTRADLANPLDDPRVKALEAKLAKVKDDVITSVGEAFAGMSHEHASPYTRAKIKEAIDRVFIGL